MIQQTLKTVYLYNGIRLTAPVEGMSAQEVKDFFSGVYPELTNASISDPAVNGDELHYSFVKAVGTKG